LKLHFVYRLYGGENLKGRPPYYNKRASLASALDAAERAGADIVVLADGPIPEDLRLLASKSGRVVALPDGPIGMRRSFMAGLRWPDVANWPDDDLVYFCEDDYLHQPHAMVALVSAATTLESAHYFALYGSTPRHPAAGPGLPFHVPAYWEPQPEHQVGETTWVNIPNTASTFGARIGTLRQDIGIFRQSMIPYPTRYLDYEMFLVVQGRFPYSVSELFRDHAATRFRTGLKGLAGSSVLAPFRVAYELRTLTRRRDPHLLYAADPNLACHMETQFLSPGTDWSSVADHAAARADASGAGV
jgi:hypothetical protein